MDEPTQNKHYMRAVELLDSIEGHNEALPFVKSRIAKAHVHALLAQCRPQ